MNENMAQDNCGKFQKRLGPRQARERKTVPDRSEIPYSGAAQLETRGRLGVEVTVLGRVQVKGGLF